MKYTLEKLKACIDTANELGCVLRWIAGCEKEQRRKWTIAKKKGKEANERKDIEWEGIWQGYQEGIEEFLPIKKEVNP